MCGILTKLGIKDKETYVVFVNVHPHSVVNYCQKDNPRIKYILVHFDID